MCNKCQESEINIILNYLCCGCQGRRTLKIISPSVSSKHMYSGSVHDRNSSEYTSWNNTECVVYKRCLDLPICMIYSTKS